MAEDAEHHPLVPDGTAETLLRGAALAQPDRAFASWTTWRENYDSGRFAPASQWWLPLVWWNLRDAPLANDDREWLRREYQQAWLHHQHAAAFVGPLLSALEAAGVRTLLLKGASLAMTTYPRPGLRPFGDVDILVPPHARSRAREVVEARGWVPIRRLPPGAASSVPSLNYTDAHGVDVDMHWASLAECSGPGADDRFWARAESIEFGGAPTSVLCAEDQFLHVCVHGQRFAWIPTGHWLADAHLILRNAGDAFRWNDCVAEAHRRRVGWQLHSAVNRLQSVGLASLSDTAVKAISALRGSWWEPLELRAKGRTSHAAAAILAACAAARDRAVGVPPRQRLSTIDRLKGVASTDSTLAMVTREVRRVARLEPTKEVIRRRLFGRTVHVVVDAALDAGAFRAAFDGRLPPAVAPATSEAPDRVYEVLPMAPATDAPFRFRVLANRRALTAAPTLDDAVARLVVDLQTYLATTAPGLTFVHAGVVQIGERALLLPGASGCGKSTLVAALVRAGARYGSDEFAVLDRAGAVQAYARDLRLRDEGGRDTRVPAHALGMTMRDTPVPVGVVLFTAFRACASFVPEPITPGAALVELLTHAPGAQTRSDLVMPVLRAIVTQAQVWAGERGDAAAAAETVLKNRAFC